MGEPDTEQLIDIMMALLQPLLQGMDVLLQAGRRLHPPRLAELTREISPYEPPLSDGFEAFRAASWPETMTTARERLEAASVFTLQGFQGLRDAAEEPDGIITAYRALRRAGRAQEALYPLARTLPPVSQFFLEPARRDDKALLASLHEPDPNPGKTGILHFSNDRKERGGFSLYVPEYYDGERAWPVVVALHGGRGHGREFLWSWLRAARGGGAIVLSPTARGDTWALMGPDIDSANLNAMLDRLRENWRIDENRLLLTGMSDGGTFSYVSGLTTESPFSHLAPVSASFHPMLLEMCDAERLAGLPIYLTQGALDWMFPVDIARTARDALKLAGAEVTYREIEDLSHTYPREESAAILNWLKGEKAA